MRPRLALPLGLPFVSSQAFTPPLRKLWRSLPSFPFPFHFCPPKRGPGVSSPGKFRIKLVVGECYRVFFNTNEHTLYLPGEFCFPFLPSLCLFPMIFVTNFAEVPLHAAGSAPWTAVPFNYAFRTPFTCVRYSRQEQLRKCIRLVFASYGMRSFFWPVTFFSIWLFHFTKIHFDPILVGTWRYRKRLLTYFLT